MAEKEYKGVGGAMVVMAALCIANAPTIIPSGHIVDVTKMVNAEEGE